MSQATIKESFEAAINAMTPSLAIAVENVDFKPTEGTPYQVVNLLPATPDNSVHGSSHYIEQGLVQVTLCYPENAGAGGAYARAELIRTTFKRGTTLTKDGLLINVINTPSILPPITDGERYRLPVRIFYQADVFS